MPLNIPGEGKEQENRRIELVFAPNRVVKKGHSVATLLQEESQRALHYSAQESSEPQVEIRPPLPGN